VWHFVRLFFSHQQFEQGRVLSPVLFCLYVDGLLVKLSKAGIGCFVGSNFVRALAYANDIVLAPTAWKCLSVMLTVTNANNAIATGLSKSNRQLLVTATSDDSQ